jgi:CheY-like chemotaxis protein
MMSDEKLKILLVDDEQDLCKVAAWDFEDAGFEVTKAYGGVEAFGLLQKKKYDFLISDIKMPKGDGVELIRSIQDHEIPLKGVFLMTGYADYPEKSLRDLGMTELFQKPIDIDQVIATINKFK